MQDLSGHAAPVYSPIAPLSPLLHVALLSLAGLVGGAINAVAGAGSMITLPALMVVGGLPASVANATNRIAVLVQSLSATASFRQQRVQGMRIGLWLALPACVGSLGGAWLATVLPETTLRRVIGVVFLVMLVPILRPRRAAAGEGAVRATPATFAAFLVLGLYGGFVQVGVGILVLVLFSMLGMSLVEGNQVKVVTVAALTLVALALFLSKGLVAWRPGLVVAAGSAVGGWFGARLSVRRGERFIRAFLLVAAVASSLQLLGVL